MSERQGVEIDYCPECRGIWLDRGELDKILERARVESQSFAEAPQPPQPAVPAPRSSGHGDSREDHGYDRGDHRYGDRRSDDRRRDDRGYDRGYDSHSGRRDGYGDPRSRRRKSPFDFLGEIFD